MSAPSPHLKRFLRLRLFVHSMVSGSNLVLVNDEELSSTFPIAITTNSFSFFSLTRDHQHITWEHTASKTTGSFNMEDIAAIVPGQTSAVVLSTLDDDSLSQCSESEDEVPATSLPFFTIVTRSTPDHSSSLPAQLVSPRYNRTRVLIPSWRLFETWYQGISFLAGLGEPPSRPLDAGERPMSAGTESLIQAMAGVEGLVWTAPVEPEFNENDLNSEPEDRTSDICEVANMPELGGDVSDSSVPQRSDNEHDDISDSSAALRDLEAENRQIIENEEVQGVPLVQVALDSTFDEGSETDTSRVVDDLEVMGRSMPIPEIDHGHHIEGYADDANDSCTSLESSDPRRSMCVEGTGATITEVEHTNNDDDDSGESHDERESLRILSGRVSELTNNVSKQAALINKLVEDNNTLRLSNSQLKVDNEVMKYENDDTLALMQSLLESK